MLSRIRGWVSGVPRRTLIVTGSIGAAVLVLGVAAFMLLPGKADGPGYAGIEGNETGDIDDLPDGDADPDDLVPDPDDILNGTSPTTPPVTPPATSPVSPTSPPASPPVPTPPPTSPPPTEPTSPPTSPPPSPAPTEPTSPPTLPPPPPPPPPLIPPLPPILPEDLLG